MRHYTLTHLSDDDLLRNLAALVARDRATTAMVLAHIAEVDARKLYVPAGYSSMYAYCVDQLRLSEDEAKRRIHAARAARQFPAIFEALAEGRLHLTGICLLAPHLSDENARALIEAASNKGKAEIEELLARHFQVPEMPVRLLTPVHSELQEHLNAQSEAAPFAGEGALEHLPKLQNVVPPALAERYRLQLDIARSTRDKLRHAQALLSHAVPSGDAAEVIDRALDALIVKLEARKAGRVRRPRPETALTPRGRHVPAHVRRAIWARDEARCTFVGSSGNRCEETRFLEFDHVDPVARGGKAMVDNMRLRCRAHNHYEAERALGARFMRQRREARAAARAQDVVAGLRNLGCRASEARRAVEQSAARPNATLEERMREALRYLSNHGRAGGTRSPG
jgi:5-methylcytosine-specific restriction endonuclease McrA